LGVLTFGIRWHKTVYGCRQTLSGGVGHRTDMGMPIGRYGSRRIVWVVRIYRHRLVVACLPNPHHPHPARNIKICLRWVAVLLVATRLVTVWLIPLRVEIVVELCIRRRMIMRRLCLRLCGAHYKQHHQHTDSEHADSPVFDCISWSFLLCLPHTLPNPPLFSNQPCIEPSNLRRSVLREGLTFV